MDYLFGIAVTIAIYGAINHWHLMKILKELKIINKKIADENRSKK